MKAIAATLAFAFACGAAGAADPAKERIEADYRAAKAQCAKIADRKDRKVCDADAKGHRQIALADLKGDAKHGKWQNENLARENATAEDSDARYAAEKSHCRGMPKDKKERCIADAKKKYSKG